MAESDYEVFWQEALNRTKQEVGEQAFPIWFDLKFLKSYEDTITIGVPSLFYLDRLKEKRYLSMIEENLLKLTGRKLGIAFEVTSPKDAAEDTPDDADKERDEEIITVNKKETTAKSAPKKKERHSQMREEYTFERYIVGDNNNYAVSVAKAIGLNPGTTYNPFLVYGGVGLGKTHLMQAIGNFIHHNLDNKVVCITSEHFLNEFVDAINNNDKSSMAAFKNRYRNAPDVFLLDDIQFFEGKEAIQEELFHTFNTLLDAKKQVVFTCDRPVSELKKIPERLKSRFESCLKIDLQPPKYEARCAIIKKKAEERKIIISDDVVDLISKNVSTNIRDLEGALYTLIPYAEIQKTPITIDIAQKLLRDMFASPKLSNLSVDLIIRTVSDYFSLTPNDIKGRKKNKNVALARHITMYIAYELGEYSLTEIGRDIGGRDHTTVMHSCNVIKEILQSDPTMEPTIENIKRLIREKSTKL